jgi:hypothetical protein
MHRFELEPLARSLARKIKPGCGLGDHAFLVRAFDHQYSGALQLIVS